MSADFIELKSTDNTTVYIRREAINGFEIVPPSTRVDGHVKVFVGGFKFLIAIDKDELLKKLK
jgi:hypothetical protein